MAKQYTGLGYFEKATLLTFDDTHIMGACKSAQAKDINQLATSIVEDATAEPKEEKPEKNPAAVALERLGGLKGRKARAAKLSDKKRKEIAKKADKARWENHQT